MDIISKIKQVFLLLLDLSLNRNSFLRYSIWKFNDKKAVLPVVNNNFINFGVIYYSEAKLDNKKAILVDNKLKQQNYKNYELILDVSDADIDKFTHICFIEEGDLIHKDALSYLALEIEKNNPDLIYTDQDELNFLGIRINPYFKTEYAEFLLYSHNYMDSFLCVKNTEKVLNYLKNGISHEKLYSLVIDTSKTGKVSRIPKVLYHKSSKNVKKNKNRPLVKPVEKALSQENILDKVKIISRKNFNCLKFYPVSEPLISIIIPFKDKVHFTKMCIDSIERKSTYKNFEIILVNNRSIEPKTFKYLDSISHKVVNADIDFNYSRLNNIGVQESKGDYLVLMNNDIEINTHDWMERLLGLAELPKVGEVGPKLLYPNNRIQHVGMVLYKRVGAKHVNRLLKADDPGYRNYNNLLREYQAFTGACVMISKNKYLEVGGLTEDLSVISNDVDFSLKLREKGYVNLYCPDVVMYHHESITRKGKDKEIKGENLTYFYRKWGRYLGNDPYFNPNFSYKRRDFAIRIDNIT